jgi:NAD/NADP transhydrogenase alpha subunit|nr:pyridine nucleotide transhydrogenase [Bacillota bacterium]
MGEELVIAIYLLVLAAIAGYEVITKVPPILHTPLMSGTNAISGVVVIGALLVTLSNEPGLLQGLGFLAIILATINVVGGFLVTDRMLGMFKRREGDKR